MGLPLRSFPHDHPLKRGYYSLIHFEVLALLGMADRAAIEIIELAAETHTGQATLDATERALAEVMDSMGVKIGPP